MRNRLALSLTPALLLAVSSCAILSPPVRPGFVVFFTERSAEIDASARSTIATAASQATASGSFVAVVGWTDSAGSPAADVTLSRMRAQNVADALAADGVPPARITQRGRGQTGDDPGVESRRVNIEVGN